MTRGRRALFLLILVGIPLVAVNALAAIVIAVLTDTNPFDREAFVSMKAQWRRTALPATAPHPFVGQVATSAIGTGGTLSGAEPLYVPMPGAAMPARPVRVLVLGGSLATHLTRSDDSVSGDGVNILQGVLREEFGTDRFVVYNAATGGGKQPQQLFRAQYLYLLGERFDVVVNVDGFNELALPLVETSPLGLPAVVPRAYPQLQRAYAVDTRCVERSNRYIDDYSVIPVVELVRLVVVRRCVRRLDYAPPAVDEAVAQAWRSKPLPADQALAEAVTVWGRSSAELQALVANHGGRYVHVLQPNQHLADSKPLSDAERAMVADGRLGDYARVIGEHYQSLDFAPFGIRNGIDLRRVFAENRETLYFDACCHLNNAGLRLLSEAIVKRARADFQAALAGR